jgi:hypothetical protein
VISSYVDPRLMLKPGTVLSGAALFETVSKPRSAGSSHNHEKLISNPATFFTAVD